jgi:hypothetical protein
MATTTEAPPVRLRFPFAADASLVLRPGLDLADDANFYTFCQDNADLRIERSATGELNIEMPTKSLTSKRNFQLLPQPGNRSVQNGLASVSSSAEGLGFRATRFALPTPPGFRETCPSLPITF